ncbi:MAG TPA: hypothetical protein VE090_00505 [Methylomirabilota bacterium]|nr:hypothetical protein [Methylomirabilota bacterium]
MNVETSTKKHPKERIQDSITSLSRIFNTDPFTHKAFGEWAKYYEVSSFLSEIHQHLRNKPEGSTKETWEATRLSLYEKSRNLDAEKKALESRLNGENQPPVVQNTLFYLQREIGGLKRYYSQIDGVDPNVATASTLREIVGNINRL